MSSRPSYGSCTLKYPKHVFKPEDLLDFIETRVFTRAWEDLRLTDDDLFALQLIVMSDPKVSPVIPGTGGLRKLRFAPPEWQRGKRGALRVCYVYFEEFHIVLLVIVYSKSEQDDLSDQQKRVIKKLIDGQREELARGPIE